MCERLIFWKSWKFWISYGEENIERKDYFWKLRIRWSGLTSFLFINPCLLNVDYVMWSTLFYASLCDLFWAYDKLWYYMSLLSFFFTSYSYADAFCAYSYWLLLWLLCSWKYDDDDDVFWRLGTSINMEIKWMCYNGPLIFCDSYDFHSFICYYHCHVQCYHYVCFPCYHIPMLSLWICSLMDMLSFEGSNV